MMPNATEPESSNAMIVSVSRSVCSLSQRIAAATSRLKSTIGHVGSSKPRRKPKPMPASAPCAMVSLKKAIRRAVTNTPISPHSGAMMTATAKARSMKGSRSARKVIGIASCELRVANSALGCARCGRTQHSTFAIRNSSFQCV